MSGFFFLLSLAAAVACVVAVVLAVRRRSLKLAGGFFGLLGLCFIFLTVGAVLDGSETEAARVAGGFETQEQLRAANKAGFTTKAAQDAHNAAVKAAGEKSVADTARAREEAAAKAAQAREEAAAKAAKADAECRKELKCWAEKFNIEASVQCRRPVESLAKFSFEWTDGWLESKFSHYRWKDASAGVVTYIGDKAKFQNGFGAWQPHTYECDFDTASKQPLAVRANPGRLN